ncbi:MAG: hypothetical protein ABJC36_13540 [Gemmatimonadales bacterium]
MDPGSLGALVPVAAILVYGAVKITGIQAKARAGNADPQSAARLESMEAELGTLRQELGEVHERLDFAERLLAQHTPTRIDPPK